MSKSSVIRSLFFIAVLNTGLLAAKSDSQRAFLDAEAILAAWESTYASIKTMRVSYVERLIEYKPPQSPSGNSDEQYGSPVKFNHVERIEAGKRYHLRYSLSPDGFDDPERLVEFAFNGKNTQSYTGNSKSGVISPGQKGGSEENENALKRDIFLTTNKTPDILKDKYPNGIPELTKWFKLGKLRAKVIVRPNLETVNGESCHVVEIIDDSDVGGKPRELKKIYWLAHNKGMCPMKYRWVLNGEIESEMEVTEIAAVDMDGNEIWYPKKSFKTILHGVLGMTKNELTVTEFVPNVEVDDSTFVLDYPPGTHVSDRVLGLSYIVGGAGPAGKVSLVRDISSAEKGQMEIEAQRKEPVTIEPSSEPTIKESDQPIENDTQKEEGPIPVKSDNVNERILGLKTFSIFGVLVLVLAALMVWRKRSADTIEGA